MRVSPERFKQDMNNQFSHDHGDKIIVSTWETKPYIDKQGDEVVNIGITGFNLTPAEIEKLPSEIDGVKCLYSYESEIRFLSLPTKNERHDELIGGISFGATDISAGTLGGVVWDKTNDNPYLLTNEHVVSDSQNVDPAHPPVGHPILQPGVADGGTHPADLAGTLVAVGGMKDAGLGDQSHNCDAAIASPERNLSETYYLGLGEVSKKAYVEAQVGDQVIKSGRTTGVTKGLVVGVGVSANIGGMAWNDPMTMVDLIQVNPGTAFVQGGDSGSRAFKYSTMEPFGLVFAGGETSTFIIRAAVIEDTLNVTFNNEPSLWIYPKEPDLLYIPKGGTILCGCRGDYPEFSVHNWAGIAAIWTVGPGLTFTWSSGSNRTGGLEVHSDGTYTGSSWVKCEVPSVGDDVTRSVEIVEVDFFEQEDFTTLEILDRSLNYLTTIPNHEIVDLTIKRELSGAYAVEFTIPYNATGATSISRGRYIKTEGNHFTIDSIDTARDINGVPTIVCRCNHEFFETRSIPTAWREDYYSHFMSHYRLALFQTRLYDTGDPHIVPCCLYTTDEWYHLDRYGSMDAEKSRLDTFRQVFQTFGGDFFFWRNYVITLPYEAVLPAPDLTFEYSLNTHTIRRVVDETSLLTEVFGYGGTVGTSIDPYKIQSYAKASDHIFNLYRLPRVGYIDFGDVVSHYELTKMVEQYMNMLERTRTTYTLTVAELKRLSSPPSGDFEIDIGKTVLVKDTDLGIEETHRIISYTYKPLSPEFPASIVVGSKPKHMFVPVVPERNVRFHGALEAKDTGTGSASEGATAPRRSAQCIVSTDDPDFSRGQENDIWIKYVEGE